MTELTRGDYLDRVSQTLADVYTPEGVRIAMRSANSALDHNSPDELIRTGHGAEVLAWAESLASGNFA